MSENKNIKQTLSVFYVKDQAASTAFYQAVFDCEPVLNVPGMTEFKIGQTMFGLMPETGIKKLLGDALPDPSQANGVPRSELYLIVDEPAAFHARALSAGAKELSPLAKRDWGDEVAYSLDRDGHVLAFAKASD